MKNLLIALMLIPTMVHAQDSFMLKFNGKLNPVTANNKLWCSNGVVSFRYIIEKIDLSSPHFRDNDIKIKYLLVKNEMDGTIASYVKSPVDLFNSDVTYSLKGNNPVYGFPSLILKSMPHSTITRHSIINDFKADINENGIPYTKQSAELRLDFSGTDYVIGRYQNYFGSAIRGDRLIIHCGGWDFEKEHSFDPNPFE